MMRGHLDVCLAILARPDFSFVNVKNDKGCTALHVAADDGFHDVASAILNRQDFAEVNAVNGFGWTALQFAASNGHYLVCQLLVQHPEIDLNYHSEHGWTAAHRAADRGHTDVRGLILSQKNFTKAHVVVKNAVTGSPMGNVRDLAVRNGHVLTVQEIENACT